MRTVQGTLRAVVKAGWYGNPTTHYNSEFMCRALRRAVQDDVITEAEYHKAAAAINKYIRSLGTSSIMSWALYNAGHIPDSLSSACEWSVVEGKEFYRNWNNRPKGIVK
jgi:hypothetical protein